MDRQTAASTNGSAGRSRRNRATTRASGAARAAGAAAGSASRGSGADDSSAPRPRRRVALLVLGDIGRSPRALYHALALARAGADVDLVGYVESERPDELDAAGIRVHALRDFRSAWRHRLPAPLFLGVAAGRAVLQAAAAGAALARAGADTVLVQVPPALPTLAVARAWAALRGARTVVDWHDFGHTQIALRLGAGHPLVAATKWAERTLGRAADGHLCVSQPMARVLADEWHFSSPAVLRDRPASRFRQLGDAERVVARRDLAVQTGCPEIDLRGGAAALVVSPTSFTPDEDFGMLFEAAGRLDVDPAEGAGGRTVVFVVTGRGPGQAAFEARARTTSLRRSRIVTAWLPADAYPRAIAAADLGLCLHRSSSGLDLPMKIQDLLGAGVPVLAFDYGETLRASLGPGSGGATFADAADLAARIRTLLLDAAQGSHDLHDLRAAAVAAAAGPRWEEEWVRVAAPIVLG